MADEVPNVIPLCKSTLHRPRASRPLASRVEEEAVRDDVRVVRTSVLHQVSPAALGEAKAASDCCRCTRRPAQASPNTDACPVAAKVAVRGGLVPTREMDTANSLEFGGDRKTIGKL